MCLSFFFKHTASSEIYTLSLHDALPISDAGILPVCREPDRAPATAVIHCCNHADSARNSHHPDRKSTRLNSSHRCISYAVFCLKKKKKNKQRPQPKQIVTPKLTTRKRR